MEMRHRWIVHPPHEWVGLLGNNENVKAEALMVDRRTWWVIEHHYGKVRSYQYSDIEALLAKGFRPRKTRLEHELGNVTWEIFFGLFHRLTGVPLQFWH